MKVYYLVLIFLQLYILCRHWKDLTAEMEKYLIRMRSPADLFPFLVNDLSEKLNITDAAILYDKSFGMMMKLN